MLLAGLVLHDNVDVEKRNYPKYWQQFRLSTPFDIEPSLVFKRKVKKINT